MNISIHILIIIASIALQYIGVLLLVKYTKKIAVSLSIKKYIYSLSVLSFSIFSPQLFLCIFAKIHNYNAITTGSIIGYNISVIGLLIPLLAFNKTFKIRRSFLKFELPIQIFICLLFLVLSLNKVFGYYDTILFLGFYLFFLILNFIKKKNTEIIIEPETMQKQTKIPVSLLISTFGLTLIITSSYLYFISSIKIANFFNINLFIYSLIFIPICINIPVIIKTVREMKKEIDLDDIIEKILHSGIYTILLITGILTLISPITVNKLTGIYTVLLIGISALFTLLLIPTLRVNKIKAGVIFSIYIFIVIFSVIKFG